MDSSKKIKQNQIEDYISNSTQIELNNKVNSILQLIAHFKRWLYSAGLFLLFSFFSVLVQTL